MSDSDVAGPEHMTLLEYLSGSMEPAYHACCACRAYHVHCVCNVCHGVRGRITVYCLC